MKKVLLVLLLVVGVLALTVTPGDAHGRWRGGVFIGVGPYWAPHPYWWYPPPYYAYPTYVYPPPTVVVEQPPVYVEQQPAPPAAPPAPPAYWYYCPSAKAYYPTAPGCPEEWVKVPERPR
ncbi:MAG: hypothetical protein HYY95_01530 [Candidatus Rokubacteria bacterium]|nr:hypothetical protein [Candidatus Rokubacteria bacterium]MBI3104267.1 hypothetical protein [Candidatus Rokubacteria bacterium]